MQALGRFLCLALILTVLTITLVQEISRTSDAYSFEVATRAEHTVTDTLTGYVFRDEVAPGSANNGPVHYLVKDGEAVSAGTLLAEVFRDDTGTDKRERAAILYAEIDRLQAALERQADWKSAYLADYPALMRALGAGEYHTAAAQTAQICAVLGGRACEKLQETDALRAQIAAAQAELAEMVVHTNDPAPVPAVMDGIFYHTADGYEQTFGTVAAATLTPEGLATLLAAPAEPAKSVGKLVSVGTWFLAVPTDKALADTYTVQSDYTLHFENGSLSMMLDKITLAENGEDALLLFRAEHFPTFLSCSRAQRVCVEKQTVTGLSVPACALTAENAVYVIRDGTARLCPVTPLQTKDGCTLLVPEEKNGALREGERVIVSTRQLFDGKVLE